MENPGFSILILHHGEGGRWFFFEGPKKKNAAGEPEPLTPHHGFRTDTRNFSEKNLHNSFWNFLEVVASKNPQTSTFTWLLMVQTSGKLTSWKKQVGLLSHFLPTGFFHHPNGGCFSLGFLKHQQILAATLGWAFCSWNFVPRNFWKLIRFDPTAAPTAAFSVPKTKLGGSESLPSPPELTAVAPENYDGCLPKEVYMKPGRGCLSGGKEVVWRTCVRRPVRVKHSALAAFFFGAEFSKVLLEARPIQTSLEGFSLKIGTSLELGVCLFV